MLRVERLALGNRWTRRHPAEKAVLSGGLLLLALLLPPLPGAALVAASAVVIALTGARLPAGDCARVLAPLLGFLGVGAASLAVSLHLDGGIPSLSVSAAGLRDAGAVSLRALAASASLLLFILTTPVTDALALLRRAGLPVAIVEMMLLIYRFVAITLETAANGRTAQEARLGYVGLRRTIRSAGLLAAALLPRVLDRASRMETGLAARGYTGELRVLSPERRCSPVFLTLTLLLLSGIVAISISTVTQTLLPPGFLLW
ncbi:MAG: cobalt ECF transporter T component CbiQ [Rhodospirillales bacterium]|nr:cobalt ECF transporter T component CbiQ [Rhodospirillales bacterium]